MASLATTAVRDGDEWIVNGQKVWTTFGHESEMAMLIARTDPDAPKHAGITYFGLDMRAAGVEVRPLVNIAGQLEFNEVFLTDVRVPDLDRISPVGEGWAAAMTTLGAERHALSGVRKKRKASDEILGGKPLGEVVAMAGLGEVDADPSREPCSPARTPPTGCSRWPRQRARARCRPVDRRVPRVRSRKIAKAATNQRLQELAIDLLGAEATAWAPGDDDAEEWITQFLRTRANSHRGRHLGDPTQHRRRASARAPPRTRSVQGRALAFRPPKLIFLVPSLPPLRLRCISGGTHHRNPRANDRDGHTVRADARSGGGLA